MNRLSPLIARRVHARPTGAYAGRAVAMAAPARAEAETPGWMDDLRLFATGWVGGLIFFGTLLG